MFENALEKSIRLEEMRQKSKTKERVRFSQWDIFPAFLLWKIHAESLFCNENWFYYIKFSPCSMMLIVFAKSSYYLLLLKFTFMWKTRKVSRQSEFCFLPSSKKKVIWLSSRIESSGSVFKYVQWLFNLLRKLFCTVESYHDIDRMENCENGINSQWVHKRFNFCSSYSQRKNIKIPSKEFLNLLLCKIIILIFTVVYLYVL